MSVRYTVCASVLRLRVENVTPRAERLSVDGLAQHALLYTYVLCGGGISDRGVATKRV